MKSLTVYSFVSTLCSSRHIIPQVSLTKYIHIKSATVYVPFAGIRTLPASECAPPPELKGGGAHSRAGEGLGESQFQRLEKKLRSLPALWFRLMGPSTKEGRGERKQRECLCPLSWSVHHNVARDGYIEFTCCCVQARFLGMETKYSFPCYSLFSAI